MGPILPQMNKFDNREIALPANGEIKIDDGRMLKISSWKPIVEHNCILRVEIEAHIFSERSKL